jgi:hypothetical protein
MSAGRVPTEQRWCARNADGPRALTRQTGTTMTLRSLLDAAVRSGAGYANEVTAVRTRSVGDG